MKLCTLILFLLLLNQTNYSQDLSLGTKESFFAHDFYEIYNPLLKTKFKRVKIYEINLSKKGRAKDSTLVTEFDLPTSEKITDKYFYTYDTANREWQRYEKIKGVKVLNAEKLYDSLGQLSQWIWYSTDGKIYGKTLYRYNDKRQLIQTDQCYGYDYLNSNSFYIKKVEYQYFNSNLIESREYYKESNDVKWLNIWTKRFDSLRNEIYYKDERGESFFSITSEFDNQNHKIRNVTTSNEKEVKKTIEEFFYWPDGLPREAKQYLIGKNKRIASFVRYHYQ